MGDSLLVRLARLPEGERAAIIGAMAEELGQDPKFILDDWRVLARPEQLPPPGGWTSWLFGAGRGAGKTRAASEWVTDRIVEHFEACRVHNKASRHKVALAGRSAPDIRDIMVEGVSGVVAIAERRGLAAVYEPSKRRVTWPDLNAEATLFSAEEPNGSRGAEHHTLWADELAAWKMLVDDAGVTAWENLKAGLRGTIQPNYIRDGVDPPEPRAIITTTPKRVGHVRRLWTDALDDSDPGTVMTNGSTMDNAANLAASFLNEMFTRYAGTRLEAQELLGRMLDSVEGALWSDWMIAQAETHADTGVPPHHRPIVALDPSMSDGRNHTTDEYGLIVVAKLKEPLPGRRGQCIAVLEDASGHGSPDTWARAATAAADRHGANVIVAETNQGGALVTTVIRNHDNTKRVETVHATKNKQLRAEPVSHLYEQRRVLHDGHFDELTDEMTSWVPTDTDSPNRLDALVYAITHLIPEISHPPASITTAQGVPLDRGYDPYTSDFLGDIDALNEALAGTTHPHGNAPPSITDLRNRRSLQ